MMMLRGLVPILCVLAAALAGSGPDSDARRVADPPVLAAARPLPFFYDLYTFRTDGGGILTGQDRVAHFVPATGIQHARKNGITRLTGVSRLQCEVCGVPRPHFPLGAGKDSDESLDDELSQNVREALERLEPGEKEALELFHFLGLSLEEISARMNLMRRGVERLLRSGTLKLRRLLADYAQKRYGIARNSVKRCPICHTQKRAEAEKIISSKSAEETWRRIIRELREELNIVVNSPQTLLGGPRRGSARSPRR